MAKILVAMSGGVDSSLTAALLHEQGHEVVGVTLRLWAGDGSPNPCCSQAMVADSQAVCAQIGFPHLILNYQREFQQLVIDHFIAEYARGATPNPCLACNEKIKFGLLLEYARSNGFEALATGHYARISYFDQQYLLLRGLDSTKDQAYVLFMLQQRDLAQLRFPLGDFTKAAVRAEAQKRGLITATRPESQDICFIPSNDYRQFMRAEAPALLVPGPIFDQHGQEIGQHQGLPLYTVGQRKGLGLAKGKPLFVLKLDLAQNALIVGPSEAKLQKTFLVEHTSFISAEWPAETFPCQVQIRARAKAAEALVKPLADQKLQIRFVQPQPAITPGQAAVLFEGERVLGGGYIAQIEPFQSEK